MSNILFIGQFYPVKICNTIAVDTKEKAGFSNHNFEMSLIKGFSKLADVKLRALSLPLVFSYPYSNKNFYIKKERYEKNGVSFRSVGFCNVGGINFITRIYKLKKAIAEEIKSFDGDRVNIVVNCPTLIVSYALFEVIKRIKNKQITTTLIVPDVPECVVEMNGRITLKEKILKKINTYNARLSKRYDNYVFLTNQMNEFFNVSENRYIVMEGLIDDDKVSHITKKSLEESNEDKEIILYTGTLREIFGVMHLVEVFEEGKFENSELWICGSGECADAIKSRAEKNNRIKFFGLVDSQKALELQTQATILVNPRSSAGNYTKYSFPSKTIEYLIAGKSVIMNKLPGIPEEYDKYIYYPEDETTYAWIKKIREVMKLNPEDRDERGSAGKSFIISQKSAKAQCKRIFNLISINSDR